MSSDEFTENGSWGMELKEWILKGEMNLKGMKFLASFKKFV